MIQLGGARPNPPATPINERQCKHRRRDHALSAGAAGGVGGRTGVANAIGICIGLIGIENGRAVVADIPLAVTIRVGLIGVKRARAVVARVALAVAIRVRLVVVGDAWAVVLGVVDARRPNRFDDAITSTTKR
jgi:hypothetical protein